MERETPLALVLAGHVDHGKSSLLGRLLHELDLLPAGKADELAKLSERRGVPLEWSFALDSFQAERDQAITLDTTRVRLKTPQRAPRCSFSMRRRARRSRRCGTPIC